MLSFRWLFSVSSTIYSVGYKYKTRIFILYEIIFTVFTLPLQGLSIMEISTFICKHGK